MSDSHGAGNARALPAQPLTGDELLEIALAEMADEYRALAQSMFVTTSNLIDAERRPRHPTPNELAHATSLGPDDVRNVMTRAYQAISVLFSSPTPLRVPGNAAPCVSLQAYLDVNRAKLQAEMLRQLRLRFQSHKDIDRLWRAYDDFETANETKRNQGAPMAPSHADTPDLEIGLQTGRCDSFLAGSESHPVLAAEITKAEAQSQAASLRSEFAKTIADGAIVCEHVLEIARPDGIANLLIEIEIGLNRTPVESPDIEYIDKSTAMFLAVAKTVLRKRKE